MNAGGADSQRVFYLQCDYTEQRIYVVVIQMQGYKVDHFMPRRTK